MENKGISIEEAANALNIETRILNKHIKAGNIELTEDGRIPLDTFEKIKVQQETLIGIKTFLARHHNERFDAAHVKDRNKFIDFLEDNDYFGVEIIEPNDILFEYPDREDFYITKEDAQLFEYKSEEFFKNFGLTEKEKVYRLIKSEKNHPVSTNYLKDFIHYLEDEKNLYTPAFVSFVRTVYDISDIPYLTDEEIISIIDNTDAVLTKEYIVRFLKYVAQYEDVQYHNVELKKKEQVSATAYPYEKFLLARILFNKDYDKEHHLTAKALDNHTYAEAWMFLSCHYICGWRSTDICNRWIYPDLKDNDNPFKINVDTLKEDILNDSISDETYDKITLYVLRRIEMANNAPQKTGKGKLRSAIVPELRSFFGKLILIAEYHHLTSGDGYMNAYKIEQYRNWVTGRAFFGEDFYKITGRQNISPRRLNKSYLQGIEQAARDNGNTTLVAHVIASFARNHTNVDTTAIYLKDHGLTGESADVVLYMMMQRGVFGVSLYTTLLAAYPEAFEKLSMKEQTEIMSKIPLSAYEIETLSPVLLASKEMTAGFSEGKTQEPAEILKAMFAISQDRGHSKDDGIYCIKKALSYACVNPTYELCIGNLCPYHIFTNNGVPSLLKVIKDYQKKAKETGNRKYIIALNTKIIPAFQSIINEIIKGMSEQEKLSVKSLIKEGLHG